MMDFDAPEYKNRQNLSEIVTTGYRVDKRYRVVKTLPKGTFDVFKADMRTVWTPPTSGDVWTGSIFSPANIISTPAHPPVR
jgi:hypothetical protein